MSESRNNSLTPFESSSGTQNKQITIMYKAIAFASDGEYITEGEFKTVEDAWERINDWGSRWIFYPFTGVMKNKRVVQMCDVLSFLNNRDIKTIQREFRENEKEFCERLALL